jgi:hypothetical protein
MMKTKNGPNCHIEGALDQGKAFSHFALSEVRVDMSSISPFMTV